MLIFRKVWASEETQWHTILNIRFVSTLLQSLFTTSSLFPFSCLVSVMMIMMSPREAALEPAQPTVEWQISVHSARAVVRPARNQQLSQELVMGPGHCWSNRGQPHSYKAWGVRGAEQANRVWCISQGMVWQFGRSARRKAPLRRRGTPVAEWRGLKYT